MLPSLNWPSLIYSIVLDLENIKETEDRRKILFLLESVPRYQHLIVGAADLSPGIEFPFESWEAIALLHKTKEAYLQRVDRRNVQYPEKAGQNESLAYDAIRDRIDRYKERFRLLIDPDDYEGNPEQLAKYILASLKLS